MGAFEPRRTSRVPRQPTVDAAMAILAPVLFGVGVGLRWPKLDDRAYDIVAQVIATLFIALAVELLAQKPGAWRDPAHRVQAVALVLIAWFGLFGCIRAIFDDGSALTAGLAAAGLAAASALIALAAYARATDSSSQGPTWLVVLLLMPPFALLVAF